MSELPNVDEAEGLPLEVFAGLSLVLHVESELVGGVLFVSNDYVAAPGDPVAYRAWELASLLWLDQRVVRLTHAVKSTFAGARVTATERMKA
jgi:hypothetical protein